MLVLCQLAAGSTALLRNLSSHVGWVGVGRETLKPGKMGVAGSPFTSESEGRRASASALSQQIVKK